MITAGLLTVTSCSDFDDYNEVQTDVLHPSSSLTLWENISQDPSLSDFKELIEKAGFADELQASNYYTVWAPKNGSFDKSQYLNIDSALLLKQFVKNHIASYNHPVTGFLEKRIFALNRKVYDLTGADNNYTYADVALDVTNIPSSNGLLHTLDGVAGFYFNLYEYIQEQPIMDIESQLDSISAFFNKYELRYLDLENSVIGPMVDGKQTYIDSVMIIQNSLLRRIGADLQNEDSVYTMLLPTNKAWNDAYSFIKPYYNYTTSISMQDLETATGPASIPTLVLTNIPNKYMSDSLAKQTIVTNLVYSNKEWYNQWMDKGLTPSATDTLRSTNRRKFSNPAEIFAETIGEPIKMSNGWGRKVDSLAFYSWELFAPEIDFNPRNTAGIIANASSAQNITMQFGEMGSVNKWGDFSEKGLTFFNVEPSAARTKPEIHFYIPNVLSTNYKFYCVFVPGEMIGNDTLPNRVNFTLTYSDSKGALATHKFSSDYKYNPSKQVPFINDPTKVDTVYLGDFQFPVSYHGLTDINGREYHPTMKIVSDINAFNSTQMKTYTRSLRIAAIILKPVELSEFEEKQK